ncbi:MAG TPA: SDR family oxidoreductase [Thermodesulfobacteriota bacterium]|mgnify:CR=1 FL=1|nr:SDR family oxidoreductase [Thermodesulfobacteriota bacterium]
MGLLDDKVIIVTGATSGIGEATAIEIAREGGRVVLAGRREDRGKAILKKIKKEKGIGYFVRTDVTKEKDIKNLVDLTEKKYGKLDGAFNNAGSANLFGTLDTITTDAYDQLMDVNLRSIFLCMKYEIPKMKKNGSGAIVNCSSMVGLVAFPQFGVYVATKHGVIGLSKSAAVDHGKDGIRVNCVLPGPIETELWSHFSCGSEVVKNLADSTLLKRSAKPIEIAKPVVFLLSDSASYITGALLSVDGGITAI